MNFFNKTLLIALTIIFTIGTVDVFSMKSSREETVDSDVDSDGHYRGRCLESSIPDRSKMCPDEWSVVAGFLMQEDARSLTWVSKTCYLSMRNGLSHIDLTCKSDDEINEILFIQNTNKKFRSLTSFDFSRSEITNATLQHIIVTPIVKTIFSLAFRNF